jgi:hypothetical protein
MKYYGYRFPEEPSYTQFFKFKKDMILSANSLWAKLPLSSKSVYPVIGCHCNMKGEAFPSVQTVADLAGITRKTAGEGIKGLMKLPWFKIKSRVTKRGIRSKTYIIGQDERPMFPFHKIILESGVWRELSTNGKSKAAHAVYCVCRAYGFTEPEIYNESTDEGLTDTEFWNDTFPYRDFDFMIADNDIVAQKAGVYGSTVEKAIQALIDNFLMEYDERTGCYRVNRFPSKVYRADYLNKELEKTQEGPGSLYKERVNPFF